MVVFCFEICCKHCIMELTYIGLKKARGLYKKSLKPCDFQFFQQPIPWVLGLFMWHICEINLGFELDFSQLKNDLWCLKVPWYDILKSPAWTWMEILILLIVWKIGNLTVFPCCYHLLSCSLHVIIWCMCNTLIWKIEKLWFWSNRLL